MGKGENQGMGTVIGAKDHRWYGNSGVEGGKRDDADDIDRRRNTPLTAQAEKRISDLRVDIAGLRRELDALDNARQSVRGKISQSEKDLATLLHQHGLPLDKGLERPVQNHGPNSSKRKRAKTRKKKPKAAK